jgi:hypothetical protein
MWHRTPSVNPLCSAKLDILAVYFFLYSVCDVQVQHSGDSSKHGWILTEDQNNFKLEKFFSLRGTNGLSACNFAKGFHGILPANDVLVDVLCFVPRNLLSILMNLLVHARHAIHKRLHVLVTRYRFPLKRQCVYLRLLSN